MTSAQRRSRLGTHFSEQIPVVKQRMSVCQVGYSGSQFTAGFLIKFSCMFLIPDIHPVCPAVTVCLNLVTRWLTPFSCLVHLCFECLRVVLPLSMFRHNCDVCVCVCVCVYSCVICKYISSFVLCIT